MPASQGRTPAATLVRGLLAGGVAYVALIGLVTLAEIVVDPVGGNHPSLFPVHSAAYFLGWLIAIAAPTILVLRPGSNRTHRAAWSAGVLAGAAIGTLVGPVIFYPIFVATAHAGEFDVRFWYAMAIVATFVIGIPAGVVAFVLTRQRQRAP
jgi:hypothetical protein